jgi:hypothetical protein
MKRNKPIADIFVFTISEAPAAAVMPVVAVTKFPK